MTTTTEPLRIGFVPEHFSTPLHFAVTHYSLSATLIPFPSGTGHLISSLRANEIDVALGLTEGFVAGLGPKRGNDDHKDGAGSIVQSEGGYTLVGTYVESPLRWAISTGARREDIKDVADLRGSKMGVSRIGSGSYVMGFVLADQQNWLSSSSSAEPPFTAIPLQTFAGLREAVNVGTADFFMWEYFTSKAYFSTTSSSSSSSSSPSSTSTSSAGPPLHPIRQIGEIPTPWPSWHIAARSAADPRLPAFFTALDQGIARFGRERDEAVGYIVSNLPYSREDAERWYGEVRFAGQGQGTKGQGKAMEQGNGQGTGTKGVSRSVLRQTVEVLAQAGVLAVPPPPQQDGAATAVQGLVEGMLGIERD